MNRPVPAGRRTFAAALFVTCLGLAGSAASWLGGALPGPFPLFPADNWWNLDISTAPVDPGSAAFISFINNGGTKRAHPDFGGNESPGSVAIYGFPYIVVDSAVAKATVQFQYSTESDGVNHQTNQSFPFYPIPTEAITEPHWVEGGAPGNVDQRSSSDRRMLIVDRDNRDLYELYNVFYDGSRWHAGSGAFFDLDLNGRRPDSGTYDTRWDNGVLNPAFSSLTANDFEVIQLGYRVTATPPSPPFNLRIVSP